MAEPRFVWLPLGVEGGLNEANLSAYLIAPSGSADFACVDAGTLLAGLKIADQAGGFDGFELCEDPALSREGAILHHHVKAYLITHPYLDHVEGLVELSPNDSPKPIMSLPGVIEDIRSHIFNWRTWPNFGDSGEPPCLAQYAYTPLAEGELTPIPGTSMRVETYPLAHGPQTDSAAFLIESEEHYFLYMGDTGPDAVEGRATTKAVWRRIVPLLRDERLRTISIECSYTDARPDGQLFSHLTPAWLLRAFRQLAELVDPQHPQRALAGLTVLVAHIKPHLGSGESTRQVVEAQLAAHNDLGLRFVLATQGQRLTV